MSSFPLLNSSTVTISLAVAVLSLVVFSKWRGSQSLPYPPGPPPDPIIGNMRAMASGDLERVFASWGKKYGDVNYATVMGRRVIVLNSFKVARNLLEKRSGIYSGRPRLVMTVELMGWGDILSLLNVGPKFRKHRRIIQDQFSAKQLSQYAPMQRMEAYATLADLGKTPDDFMRHLKRFSAGMILNIAYGYTPKDSDDPLVILADECMSATVAAGGPGAVLCDMVPALKHWPTWAPFSGFKKHALYTKSIVERFFDEPYQWVKARMAEGTATQCIMVDLLETMKTQSGPYRASETLDMNDALHITGVLYAAGSETSAAVMKALMLALLLHPEVFSKAQEEIDELTKRERLVDFDDRDSLPYFECVMKETVRWACPVPLGLPHRLAEDDNYEGYFMPKDTTVLFNAWAITRNEEVYPEPERFMPERFWGKMDSEVAHHASAVFGFGRRVCPGKAFAESSMFLLMSNIVATMDLTKALDEAGNPITPSVEFNKSAIRHVVPFKCNLRYRSEKARSLVEQARLLHS